MIVSGPLRASVPVKVLLPEIVWVPESVPVIVNGPLRVSVPEKVLLPEIVCVPVSVPVITRGPLSVSVPLNVLLPLIVWVPVSVPVLTRGPLNVLVPLKVLVLEMVPVPVIVGLVTVGLLIVLFDSVCDAPNRAIVSLVTTGRTCCWLVLGPIVGDTSGVEKILGPLNVLVPVQTLLVLSDPELAVMPIAFINAPPVTGTRLTETWLLVTGMIKPRSKAVLGLIAVAAMSKPLRTKALLMKMLKILDPLVSPWVLANLRVML